MVTLHDVPAHLFIERLAKYLKENVDQTNPPQWAAFSKTGSHVQVEPQNADWWYVRCASLMRKVYVHGPIGLERLRADYGGRKDPGVTPEHVRKAGGGNIRKALQQLEAAGLVETVKPSGGRRITPAGRKLLNEIAAEVHKELVKRVPELAKYAAAGE